MVWRRVYAAVSVVAHGPSTPVSVNQYCRMLTNISMSTPSVPWPPAEKAANTWAMVGGSSSGKRERRVWEKRGAVRAPVDWTS